MLSTGFVNSCLEIKEKAKSHLSYCDRNKSQNTMNIKKK